MEIVKILFAVLMSPTLVCAFKPLAKYLKRRFGWKRAKPFDCEACLSFWYTLAITCVSMHIVHAIMCAWVAYEVRKMIEGMKDEYTIE